MMSYRTLEFTKYFLHVHLFQSQELQHQVIIHTALILFGNQINRDTSLAHGHSANGQRWTKPVLRFPPPGSIPQSLNWHPRPWVWNTQSIFPTRYPISLSMVFTHFLKSIHMLCSNDVLGVSVHVKMFLVLVKTRMEDQEPRHPHWCSNSSDMSEEQGQTTSVLQENGPEVEPVFCMSICFGVLHCSTCLRCTHLQSPLSQVHMSFKATSYVKTSRSLQSVVASCCSKVTSLLFRSHSCHLNLHCLHISILKILFKSHIAL